MLRVSAPNRFKLDWVRKNFATRIEELASDFYECPVTVQFELPSASAAPRRALADRAAPAPAGSPAGENLAPPGANPAVTAVVDAVQDRSRLNAELTFDNFVTGKANQLARAAALQVAENPGVSYNPLFLYGGVGLGKTHLIHAIGNALVANGNGVRVRYVHADQYVSDVVKAYQRKAFDEFKRYYHSLDLLLIDDIQFFAGKNRT